MSWPLFCDESGHDHKNTPLEVRGGIVIKTNKIWDFVQAFAEAEKDMASFLCPTHIPQDQKQDSQK